MKRIYVSSTTPDLAQHRAHLVRILAENKYRVLNESGLNTLDSLESLLDADLFIGIVAHHYGDPVTTEKSILELQFDEAIALEVPALMFLVNPDYIWDDVAYETSSEGFQRRKQFEKRIVSRPEVGFHLFTSSEDLANQVLDEIKTKYASGIGRLIATILLSSVLLLGIGIGTFLLRGGKFPFIYHPEPTMVAEIASATPTWVATATSSAEYAILPSATPSSQNQLEIIATKLPLVTTLPEATATDRGTNQNELVIVDQPTKFVTVRATAFEAQALSITVTMTTRMASATPFVRTPTRTPTLTPTLTATVPTATKTPTKLPSPTFTMTALVASATPFVPTPTKMPTLTPTLTATVPTVSPTPTIQPSPVFTSEATATAQPSASTDITQLEPCTRPQGWADYTIQRGNTLFSIARAVRSTVRILADVNCLVDADAITTGQVIYIPFLPSQPIQTTTPSASSPSNFGVFAVSNGSCPSENVSITSPKSGTTLSGTFSVYGTARQNGEPFQYYRLEIRPAFSQVYNYLDSKTVEVVNGVLGNINANLFDNGVHYLRLTVVNNTGNYPDECIIPIVFSGN